MDDNTAIVEQFLSHYDAWYNGKEEVTGSYTIMNLMFTFNIEEKNLHTKYKVKSIAGETPSGIKEEEVMIVDEMFPAREPPSEAEVTPAPFKGGVDNPNKNKINQATKKVGAIDTKN